MNLILIIRSGLGNDHMKPVEGDIFGSVGGLLFITMNDEPLFSLSSEDGNENSQVEIRIGRNKNKFIKGTLKGIN